MDRVNGLEGVRTDIVMRRIPHRNGKVELIKYRLPSYEGEDGPAPANTPGIRHIPSSSTTSSHPSPACKCMTGELVDYENSYWLCYVRGPAGIILELAEKIS